MASKVDTVYVEAATGKRRAYPKGEQPEGCVLPSEYQPHGSAASTQDGYTHQSKKKTSKKKKTSGFAFSRPDDGGQPDDPGGADDGQGVDE